MPWFEPRQGDTEGGTFAGLEIEPARAGHTLPIENLPPAPVKTVRRGKTDFRQRLIVIRVDKQVFDYRIHIGSLMTRNVLSKVDRTFSA
jgi:hypothetical protein